MSALIVNEHIRGSVSKEETLWSVLGSSLPGAETLALSEFTGDLTQYIKEKAPSVVIYNSVLGKLPVPVGTKTVVVLQDNFVAQKELLPTTFVQLLKRPFGLDFYSRRIKAQRDALAAATKIVAVSEHVAVSYGVKAEVIPIGVDTNLFRGLDTKLELRKKYGIPLGEVKIFVGSTHAVKGYQKLLKEITRNPDIFYILVVKDGATVRLANVKVFTKVSQEVLCELYNCADQFVGRSLVETLWLAPIEAMMCNILVDVTNVGIFSEWTPKNAKPREEAMAKGLDRQTMVSRWKQLIERL